MGENKNYLIVTLSGNTPSEKDIDKLREIELLGIKKTSIDVPIGNVHSYCYEDTLTVYGIQSNEANCKVILKEASIDTMFVLATEMVRGNSSLKKDIDVGNPIEFSKIKEKIDYTEDGKAKCTLDYFLGEMKFYCKNVLGNENQIKHIRILPIKDDSTKEEITNITTTIVTDDWDENTGLYVDSQGGMRDCFIMLVGTLRIARQRGIKPKMILYSMFNREHTSPTKVEDKKDNYQIFDAVSGVDEFERFGRVNELITFFGRMGETPIKPVLEAAQNMAEAFAMCFADQMVESVNNVAKEITNFKASGPDKPMLQKYVVDMIQRDLGDLLASPDNILLLIDWCLKKDFIQQAATLYIDKLPSWYFQREIFKKKEIKEKLRILTWIKSAICSDSDLFYTGLPSILNKCAWVKQSIIDWAMKDNIDELLPCLEAVGVSEGMRNDFINAIKEYYVEKDESERKDLKDMSIGGYKLSLRNQEAPTDISRFLNVCANEDNFIRFLCDLGKFNKNGKTATTRRKCDIICRVSDQEYKRCQECFNEEINVGYLKAVLAYYVLMKQLRNTTNHGGGTACDEDIRSEKEVRKNLEGIIKASLESCETAEDEDPTEGTGALFDYKSAKELLQKAINFNFQICDLLKKEK